jgi:hypothetical protein
MYQSRYFKPFVGTSEVIGSDAIVTGKIATGAVGSREVAQGSIQTEDLADGSVTLIKLGPDVPAVGIPDGSITEAKLDDASVSSAKLKTGAVVGSKIGAGAVAAVALATDAVETTRIKDDAVTKPKIADGNISPVKLEATVPPVDTEVPSFDQASGKFVWVPAGVPAVGVYVPRRANAIDKGAGDFIIDNADHVNGLDLSAIIPANAIAVVISSFVRFSAPGGYATIWGDKAAAAEDKLYAAPSLGEDVIGIYTIGCEPDRLFDYHIHTLCTYIEFTVIGWFI